MDLQRSITVMVDISPINDNPPILLLDGSANVTDSHVMFIEEGPAVLLTDRPRVRDRDVGEKNFTSATVTILEGTELILYSLSICMPYLGCNYYIISYPFSS